MALLVRIVGESEGLKLLQSLLELLGAHAAVAVQVELDKESVDLQAGEWGSVWRWPSWRWGEVGAVRVGAAAGKVAAGAA